MENDKAGSWEWIGEVIKEFFKTNLTFYDKAPIVASTGYLLLMGSLPLYLILKFASNMKRLDNEKVLVKLKLELERDFKDKERAQEVIDAANTTIAGG